MIFQTCFSLFNSILSLTHNYTTTLAKDPVADSLSISGELDADDEIVVREEDLMSDKELKEREKKEAPPVPVLWLILNCQRIV
jgi:hypothetical protein